MSFKVVLSHKAIDFLRKSDSNLREMIKNKLLSLKDNPKRGKPLKYLNLWSLRIEDYRAIYKIKESVGKIFVLFIGHRKDVYDDFSKLL